VPGKPVAPAQHPLYALHVPAHVAELIRGLHPTLKRKLRAAHEAIAADPRAAKTLKDDLSGRWSFRVGKFRVIYRIAAGRCVELVACGPRERIYEETYRLIARRKLHEGSGVTAWTCNRPWPASASGTCPRSPFPRS